MIRLVLFCSVVLLVLMMSTSSSASDSSNDSSGESRDSPRELLNLKKQRVPFVGFPDGER